MKKNRKEPSRNEYTNETVPAFGYELLRGVLVPELLGEEQSTILYWAGKSLARKYPLDSIDDIINFFHQAGWGDLSIREESKRKISFLLESNLISKRLQEKEDVSFSLESGFLAEQIQTIKNRLSDAREQIKRGGVILISVEWDHKDAINLEASRSSRSLGL